MKPAKPCILTINGGSSSIKFALFKVAQTLQPVLEGRIERIGMPEAHFTIKSENEAESFTRPVTAADH